MNKRKEDMKAEKSELMNILAELVNATLENRKPILELDGLSFEELLDIAKRNQIQYLILASAIKLPLEEEQIAQARKFIQYSMLKTLSQVVEAKKISEAFEAAGIRHQLLKGAVMKNIYPRPETREMGDIDCMVYENSFEKADEIMLNLGYSRESEIKHHVIYRKAPFLVFEMHWDLYEKTVDKEQYMYYKNQFRAKLKDNLQYTYEFSKEDFYVYLVSHMAKHFYEKGCGIRNLVDIYIYNEVYGKEMDKKVLAKELERCGLTTFETYAKELAYIWLGGKESTDFYNFMFQYMVDSGIYGKTENGVWSQLAKQEYVNNNGANFLFPCYDYMKQQYTWLDGKKILLPFAWALRGITGICNPESRQRYDTMKEKKDVESFKSMYLQLELNFQK